MSNFKGILLSGGLGTRLYPLTRGTSKQLLPVYDKPVIYYPLATLMEAGIREIMIISSPQDLPSIQRLLGDGSQLGIQLQYEFQLEPRGIADAFLIAEQQFGNSPVCLILGDNLFSGPGFKGHLQNAQTNSGATVFAYQVENPNQYGVIELDSSGAALNLVEKPLAPKSDWAVTGLYFYDSQIWDIAHSLQPSQRGELEITDVNLAYLRKAELNVIKLRPGFAWLDTGTPHTLLQAGNYVQMLQERQGQQIACLEGIALKNGWISEDQLVASLATMGNSVYKTFLKKQLHQHSLGLLDD